MSSKPTISVLLPVHNGELYLREAIDSIFAQSFSALELILIDDGSSDATANIIASYADPRIISLRLAQGGLVAALNAGFARSQGVFIARMDADDRALPDRFARQIAYFERYPKTDILCTDIYTIDAAGRRNGIQSQHGLDNAMLRQALLYRRQLKPIIHPSVMMRRRVLQDLGGYRPFTCAEDRDLWLRAIDRFGFARLNEPVLEYRIHAGGVSRSRRMQQATASAMSAVCYLIRQRTGLDLFADRPEQFECLSRDMEKLLAAEILVPSMAFREARQKLLNRDYVGGLLDLATAFMRHGFDVLPSRLTIRTGHLITRMADDYADIVRGTAGQHLSENSRQA